jgi:hypothetical protein
LIIFASSITLILFPNLLFKSFLQILHWFLYGIFICTYIVRQSYSPWHSPPYLLLIPLPPNCLPFMVMFFSYFTSNFLIWEKTWYLSFWVWLICLISWPNSIHFPINDKISLLFIVQWCSTLILYHTFFLYPSVNGHIGWFHNMVVVKRAAINMSMNVSLWYTNLWSCRYTLEWYSNIIWQFYSWILKELQNDFQIGDINLHSCQQCLRIHFPVLLPAFSAFFYDNNSDWGNMKSQLLNFHLLFG